MVRPANDPIDVFAGNAVRCARKQQGLSQEALAEQLGVTFQQVQKYERGTNRISASVLFRIAQTLKMRPDAFFPAIDDGAAAEELTPGQRLIAAHGGLQLARIYLRMTPRGRESLLNVAKALDGVMAVRITARALQEG